MPTAERSPAVEMNDREPSEPEPVLPTLNFRLDDTAQHVRRHRVDNFGQRRLIRLYGLIIGSAINQIIVLVVFLQPLCDFVHKYQGGIL